MKLIPSPLVPFFALIALATGLAAGPAWESVECKGAPTARHEAAFVEVNAKLYLLGGRGIKPVDEFDPETRSWRALAKPPIEIHHFQPLVREGQIWIVGAMTGKYPGETPLARIHIYDPVANTWSEGPEIPKDRRRGAAGVIAHDGKIYLVCGIRRGHIGGFVPWLDRFDPATGTWEVLPDAPHARDHFQAVLHEGKIYALAGRTTSQETKQVFQLTVPEVDVYEIAKTTWTTLAEPIPTPRAGNSAAAIDGQVVVAGGESARPIAHTEVEALDPATGHWKAWPSLVQARHGTGIAVVNGKLYTCSGCGRRGGKPELDTTEMLPLPVGK